MRDLDAHAWVEAWFPQYGWVRFDPTPAAAPARGGRPRLAVAPARGRPLAGAPSTGLSAAAPPASGARHASRPVLRGTRWLVSARRRGARRRRPARAPARCANRGRAALAELERALHAAGGRSPGQRWPARAPLPRRRRRRRYIRALRRRGSAAVGGCRDAQRRALRGELRDGLGPLGRVRALWALPPRWRRPSATARGLNSIAMDDLYDLFQAGTELLEAGHHHQATIPSRVRAISPRQDLDPRGPRARAVSRPALRGGGRRSSRP